MWHLLKVLEPIEEDYEFDIDDLLTDYVEVESDTYWIINYPQDNDQVVSLIGDYRSKFSRVGRIENKNKYVNDVFYNYIKSYDDIIYILKQTYKNSKTAFKLNISFGIVTEELKKESHFDGDDFELGVDYYIFPPGELERFTSIDEDGKVKPGLIHIYNKRTFNEMLAECTEEKIINWLNLLLSSSGSKLIGVFSMAVKVIELDQPIGCTKTNLPDWLINSHYITSLNNIGNNLCFFACIALAENVRRDRFKKRCSQLFYNFYGKIPSQKILEEYEGIEYIEKIGCVSKDGIYEYELMDTRFAINIYRLDESGFCCVLRKSPFNPNDLERGKRFERQPIFLNLYNNHFSYINDVKMILKYRCNICKKPIKTRQHLDEHENICSPEIKHEFNKYPQLYVKPRNKIVELCDYYNLPVNEMFIYDYLICFDLEAINRWSKISQGRKDSEQIYQIPLSFSAVSNVPGFDQVKNYISTDPRKIVNELFVYFNKVQIKANELMLEKLKPLIDKLQNKNSVGESSNIKYNRFDANNLKEIKRYCSRIPILGFNSSSYDINLMMNYGFIENILASLDEEDGPFILKNGKRYKGIDTNKYLFRDVMLYCAAGTTLAKFLECYNKDKKDHKFEFGLYRWLDKYRKLKYKIKNIPRSAFYDDLKKIEYSKEQYKNFQNECEKNNLITVLDLLEFYNNQDVVPFLKACLEYKKFFYNLQLDTGKTIKMDMFKDAFTLPGLAAKIMNQFGLPNEIYKFHLPPGNMDLQSNELPLPTSPNLQQNYLMENIESKILEYHKQDVNRIKKHGIKKNLNQALLLANSIKPIQVLELLIEYNYKCLYCHTNLNTNSWSLDRKDNNENHIKENCVISCIDCNRAKSDKPFQQFYQESYIKRNNIPAIYIVDEENKQVYNLMKENIVGGPSIVFHRYHEKDVTKIQRVHYRIDNNTWYYDGQPGSGCPADQRSSDDFGKIVKKILGFDANALYLWCIGQLQLCGILKYYPYPHLQTSLVIQTPYYNSTWDRGHGPDDFVSNLLQDVLDDVFFGMIEVDIKVPKRLYENFSEFPPIFVDEIYNSALAGETMNEIHEKIGRKHKKDKKLIATMKAKKILLKSTLLKWYLNHGLIVTRVYGIIPALAARIFEQFMDWVSEARRKGDTRPEYVIIAENCKNIGNSSFGQSIMNLLKHLTCRFVDENKFNRAKNNFNFCNAQEFTTTESYVFEIETKKKLIKEKNPIQIGWGILQDAKLKMLQFYYDCLDKYVDRTDFQLIQIDTDSMYMALSAENFNDLIKPEMKQEFELDKYNWFPRTDPEFRAFDKRTPGLFKIEKEGTAMIALCSKTYFMLTDKINKDTKKLETKIASKGAQQMRNRELLTFNNYKRSLFDIKLIKGNNAGLKYENKQMNVYEQDKIILNPTYIKGVVMDDLVHIHPLIL